MASGILKAPFRRLRRAWVRCRAGGGDWRRFASLVLRLCCTAFVALQAAGAGACELRPMADCRQAVLAGIDLRRRNLRGIDFGGADLSDADLGDADLTGARLEGTDLRGARLERAQLGYVILDGADLTGARLRARDLLATTTLSGTRMPDGSRCADPSVGLCAGRSRSAFRPARRKADSG